MNPKVNFPGHDGGMLAARLDLPDGPVRAQALFAHCFTCSKDIFAAQRIAQGLAERGIAVLRFDFTGLGHSEGEFANTNFSSNVADLVAAANWLACEGCAPQLLVGHSLGGAAVLAAAGDIASVRAVATIAAPADADHVLANFEADLARIEADGAAEVRLGGRAFTIRRQFLDDVQSVRLEARIAALRRPLLVMHAPRDAVVGIDNATRIFVAARHPKSFVSLDEADHLLTRKADARYVAEVLAAWAARYLPEPAEAAPAPDGEPGPGPVRVVETGASALQQRATIGRHRLTLDEPVALGGADSGPTPYDLLAASLGACTAMTLRMYAGRKALELGRIEVSVAHDRVHAEDCAECEGLVGRIDRFERVIAVEGPVAPGLEAKLLEIADKCPVHRTLEAASVVVTRLAPPVSRDG